MLTCTLSVLLLAPLQPPPDAFAASRKPVAVIFASGSVHGFIDHCGCARFPLGGIDRRAGYIASVRRQWDAVPHVLLDAGDFSDEPGPGGDVKTQGLLDAMNRMGYRASGLGERDLRGGLGRIEALAGTARFPLLSANLIEEGSDATWRSPATIIAAGGLKIGVLSVTRYNPSLRLPFGHSGHIVTEEPVRALKRALPPLEKSCDLIILLAAMPLEDARLLARKVRSLDLILGAHGTQATTQPISEGRTRIVYPGDQGKSLAQVRVFRSGLTGRLSLESTVVQLKDGVGTASDFQRMIVDVMARAQDAERLRMTAFDPAGAPGRGGFVGAGRCTACHGEIVSEWSTSRHAHAMETLLSQPRGFQPSCVPCHVTGHGHPGGYVDLDETPHLANVGCESCHGAGAAHIADPERPYGRVSLATCTSCHTAELDPGFNYYEDLPLVSHDSVD